MSQDIPAGDNQGYAPQIDEKPIDNQFNVVNNPNDLNQSNNITPQYPVDIKSSQNTEEDQIINDQIRNGFIRKVFGIVTIQLIFSFSFILLCQTKTIKNFIAHNEGFCILLFSISTIVYIISVCLISCNRELARKVPTNYILLFCMTFAESILSAAAAIKYPLEIVIAAIILTIAASVGIIGYTLKTKRDLSFCGMTLFALISQLLFFGFLNLIFRSNFLNLVYTLLSAIVFGLYLVYDVQLISGKFGREYSVDDYIFAAMELYIDIIRLFLEILRILSKFQKK
jgi:FtsH-binding integral membrane protein